MTNTPVTVPLIPTELLAYLQRVYPERSPRIDMEDRRIWMEAGKCELVRVLAAFHAEQNKTVLSP